MAAMAFILGSGLGIAAATLSSVFLGYGFFAAFGIYMAIGTLLPLALLMFTTDNDDANDAGSAVVTGDLALQAA